MSVLNLLKSAILGSMLLTGAAVNAQMVGTDVFIRGQYLEVGIGNLGFYGAQAGIPPAGYHSHLPFKTGIGFVADPAMDGWAVGSPPYMGDYFLPGSPFEGWELQVNGKRAQAFNTGPVSTFAYDGGMTPCTGSNTGYAVTGSVVSATWQGTIDSIDVTQITSLDTNSLYFSVKVILNNLSHTTKNDIYYFRSLDPDNDQTWPGGNFQTDNVIDHQVRDTTVVTATGQSASRPPLSLGTTDTNANAIIYGSWPLRVDQDLRPLFNKTYGGGATFYNQGVNHPGDIAIGLVIYIPHLATVDSVGDSVARTTALVTKHPANQATINYFYAFSPAAVDSAIIASHKFPIMTPPSTLGVSSVNTASDIKVYPNPAKDALNITGLNISDNIAVFDMMGRPVINNWTVYSQGTSTFSMSSLPSGSYIVIVKDAGGDVKARVPVRKL